MSQVFDEIKNYCESAQKIQEYVLSYFTSTNNDDEQRNLKLLFNEVDHQNVTRNEALFDQFLRMMAFYASNHPHKNNFYLKYYQIINEYKKVIQNNYDNEEIFNLFHQNEPILLFLSKDKVFQFDDDIKRLINNDDYQRQRSFFFPSEPFDEKYQKEGQNHTKMCQIIRSDVLQDFISYITENNVQPGSNISPSIFETNSFLIQHANDTSILEYSAFYGSINIFKYLIDNQADMLDEKIWGYAFLGSNKEIIDIITNNNVNPPEDIFESCMFNCIRSIENDTFELIKNNYAPSEKVSDDNNPPPPPPKMAISPYLCEAILSFNYELVGKYIVDENNNGIMDIFKQSSKVGFIEITKRLINLPQIKINSCGKHSALHKACIIGDIFLVKLLLSDPKVDVNVQSISYVYDTTKDFDGLTPLEYAIRYGHNKIVELLLSNDNIDVNKKSRWRGSSPIFIAAKFNNVFATKLLIKSKKIDVNAQTHDEYRIKNNLQLTGGRLSALHMACQNNNIEIVKLLMECPDIDPNILNWENKRPSDCTDNLEILHLFK